MQTINGRTVLDPEDFEPILKTMPIGGTGWIVPWAVGVDHEDTLYLSLGTHYEQRSMGTMNTLVHRAAEDKWLVRIAGYKFHRGSKPPAGVAISYNITAR
jgi:hypothetical protein